MITFGLNIFMNMDWLMIVTYVLTFVWSLWHYKMNGHQLYIWMMVISLITVILAALSISGVLS